MRAVVDGTVVAEAPEEDLVKIEGNWYFPPASVVDGVLERTDTPYTCPWKGACQYYAVVVDGQRLPDRAWSYPHLRDGAVARVGRNFTDYVAFWKEVRVTE